LTLLVVLEDRRAEGALQRTLAAARTAGDAVTILTADARLAMRLRRDGVDVRLPIDAFEGDAAAARDGAPNSKVDAADRVAMTGVAAAVGVLATFDGIDFAPYLQYTLIPSFIRAVRNVIAVQDLVAEIHPSRAVLIAGGALVQAAGLVLERTPIAAERIAGDPLTRALDALARLRGGRDTRWVNTEFRALVLEPGFLALLNLKSLWRRLTEPPPPAPATNALIVVGDRFTAAVVERLRSEPRQIVLAGATQPGRALFEGLTELVALESFAQWSDGLRTVAAMMDAMGRAFELWTSTAHASRQEFRIGDVSYWPLVRRAAALHVLIWSPKLRHVQALAARAMRASPKARLLTSTDVTAYNRVLVDTARTFGVPTMGIQHGITGEPNGHVVVHVDTLATWGVQAEDWYKKEALSRALDQRARFVVTGNPRFDSLAARVAQLPTATAGPFTVCVCTAFLSDFSVSASEYENLVMIHTVLEWARDKPDVRVIHKMHPGEEPEYYVHAARALGWDPLKMTTIREPILHDILLQSHVQVSVYSSTVLESIALGTPAIVFDAVVQRVMIDHAPHRLRDVPGVAMAYTLADVATRLDEMKAAPQQDRAALASSPQLHAFLSGLDGEATNRVAALVRSL